MVGNLKFDAVKKVREATGLILKDVVSLLTDNDWDANKAINNYTASGVAYKKSQVSRIFTYNHQGKIGVIVKLGCQTDFAAKSRPFEKLGHELCLQKAGLEENALELETPWIRDPKVTIGELLKKLETEIQESVQIIGSVKM